MRKKPKQFASGDFLQIARALENIHFSRDDEVYALYVSRFKGLKKRQNIYEVANSYHIKVSIQGYSTLVGVCNNFYDAARFADMAIAYFWNWRIRGAGRPLTDDDLNITAEQAYDDLRSKHGPLAILEEIENAVLATGLVRRCPAWNAPAEVLKRSPEEALRLMRALLVPIDECKRLLRSLGENELAPKAFRDQALDNIVEAEKSLRYFIGHVESTTQAEEAARRQRELEDDAERERAEEQCRAFEDAQRKERQRVREELDRQARAMDPNRDYKTLVTPEDVKQMVDEISKQPCMSREEIRKLAESRGIWGVK